MHFNLSPVGGDANRGIRRGRCPHRPLLQLYEILKIIFRQLLRDFIEYLADVKKVKINNEWMIEPIIAEQKKLLQQTGVTSP